MDRTPSEREQRLAAFKKSVDEMIATSDSAYVKTDNREVTTKFKMYTKDEIMRIVERGSAVERADLSKYFFTISGIYKRIILHYATFLSYAWIVVPYPEHNKKGETIEITDKAIKNAYYNATDFCTTFQIQRKCGLFAKEVLVNGAFYGLLHDNGDKVVIQDLPFKYCRTRFKNQDDIDIIEFNLQFFDDIREDALRTEILRTYPKIIQKSYKQYKNNKSGKWIFIPAEMGIYFSFFEERPFFLDLIPLLVDLDDYKDLDKERNKKALKRILAQTVPIHEGELIFEPDEAYEMHRGTCNMLKNNKDIDVITSYNKVDLLDLSSKDDQKTEIDNILNLIYESAGLSKEFFFSTTEAGLQYSTNNDLSMMMVLGDRFAHFFTTLLNYKFANKKVKFKLIILPVTKYNAKEYSERAEKQASFGYSFLTPIAVTGLDQTNLSNLKALENDLLELDEILKPLQSSYTQSGKAPGEPMGDTKGQSSEGKDKEEDKEKEEESTPQNKEKEESENKEEKEEGK